MRRPTQEVLERQYPITLYRAGGGSFVAEHRDLPGCLTQGDSVDETLANLDSARRLWITTALNNGDEVPPPSTEQRFAGRVLVRMPGSLHRRLFHRAETEGVSLNQLIVALLAAAAGMDGATPAAGDSVPPATGAHRVGVAKTRHRKR
jgi:predicted RNase H-like HicB family nuclease